jgi:hypothetical protein
LLGNSNVFGDKSVVMFGYSSSEAVATILKLEAVGD